MRFRVPIIIRKPWWDLVGPFWRASGLVIATFVGYFLGQVSGAMSGVIAFGMCFIACGGLAGAFLAGSWLGSAAKKEIFPDRRHARTPACVAGRLAPCRAALCDCGHHCGRHGLVTTGLASLKPKGSWERKEPLLDRCALCEDCAGWEQS